MKAGLILFDRMTSLDFFGFYDPVTRLKSMQIMPDFEWRLCATERQVTDDRGACILADAVSESLADYDLLFIPGGFGTRALQHDRNFIEWLSSAAPVKLKTSVCTGALLLGATGWLRNKRATTHPSAFDELAPYCAAVVDERVVDEGNVITARGVSASIDLGLHVVERLAGAGARASPGRWIIRTAGILQQGRFLPEPFPLGRARGPPKPLIARSGQVSYRLTKQRMRGDRRCKSTSTRPKQSSPRYSTARLPAKPS